MSKPSVCCVMLVNGREAMVKRAIRSFEAQTYEHKRLMIYDTGAEAVPVIIQGPDMFYEHYPADRFRKVGTLRNNANAYANPQCLDAEIICHFDSDDYSHPNRIAEQVALLESSRKEVVGYRDMLFWDETPGQFYGAWMYENRNPKFMLGTSLCYWRSVWERKPFPDLPLSGKPQSAGEDTVWLEGLNRYGYKSITAMEDDEPREPRMIASIHGGNTTGFWLQHRDKEPMFRRAPEWAEYCRVRMKL